MPKNEYESGVIAEEPKEAHEVQFDQQIEPFLGILAKKKGTTYRSWVEIYNAVQAIEKICQAHTHQLHLVVPLIPEIIKTIEGKKFTQSTLNALHTIRTLLRSIEAQICDFIDTTILPDFIHLAQHENAYIRLEAINFILVIIHHQSQHLKQEEVNQLVTLLSELIQKDSDDSVRHLATITISALGTREAIPALKHALSDQFSHTQRVAINELSRIVRFEAEEDRDAIIEALQRVLKSTKDRYVRQDARNALNHALQK